MGAKYSQLYLFDMQSGASPSPFLSGEPVIEISDRPDWCWATGQVAFNYSGDISVAVVDATGANSKPLAIPTAGMNYPTWFPDGATLAVENYASTPTPNTTTIELRPSRSLATSRVRTFGAACQASIRSTRT